VTTKGDLPVKLMSKRRLRQSVCQEQDWAGISRFLLPVTLVAVWLFSFLGGASGYDVSWPQLIRGSEGILQRPEWYLEYLRDKMREYQSEHGRYPRSIKELGPDVRKGRYATLARVPTYSFQLESATSDTYRILAREKNGGFVYELTSEWPSPRIVWTDEGQRGRMKADLLARIGGSRDMDEKRTLILHFKYLCPDREVKRHLLHLVVDRGTPIGERDIARQVLREIMCRADSEMVPILSSYLTTALDDLKDRLVVYEVLDMLAILHDRRSLAPLRSALERCPEDIPGGYLPIKTRMRELIQSLERDYGEELKGERGRPSK